MALQQERQSPIFTAFFIQLIVGGFLLIALLHRQRDLALLTFLILVIMAGAKIWSLASLKNLSIHTEVNRNRLFPEEKLKVFTRVENRKWLPVRFFLELFSGDDFHPMVEAPDLEHRCGLLWYQSADFKWELTARRRGVLTLGESQMTTGDFLGFFQEQKHVFRSSIEVVVYPRIIPIRPFDFPKKDFFSIPGAKSPVQDPIFIIGTRDYQRWQPARYIHWKASARRNRLQEKVFEPSAQAKMLFIVDVVSFFNNEADAQFERALEVTASMAVHCYQRGYSLGILTNGRVINGSQHIPVSREAHTLSKILETLGRLKMKAHHPLKQTLSRHNITHWGLSAMCFAFEIDGDVKDTEKMLKHRDIPMISVVCRQQTAETSHTTRIKEIFGGGKNLVMLEDMIIENNKATSETNEAT
jgi:uncharacterized protein (DUF58 family)